MLFSNRLSLILLSTLLDVIDKLEESVPANTREARMVWTVAPPDEDRFAHYMILRHKAPIAGIG